MTLTGYPARVTVYEVGPRDGLQNEKARVSTTAKIRYVDMLSAAGLPAVEPTAFVSPRSVPQMADADEVLLGITRRPGVRYPVLVPNEQGMQRALDAGAGEVAVFTAASESFARANINSSIDESLERFGPVAELAKASSVRMRGYISTAFGCPYEGKVSPQQVENVALRLVDLGISELSIGDTIGVATPWGVEEVLSLLLRNIPSGMLAVHFHDTRGTALANALHALLMGITTVDASSGGLGGCPFAPGASGNLATEDLLYSLHGMGIETGVDLDLVARASQYVLRELGRPPASRFLQAWAAALPKDHEQAVNVRLEEGA